MRSEVRRAFGLLLVVTMAGCGGASPAPSPVPTPVRIDGFWVGTVGPRSDSGRPLGIMWIAKESDGTVSGTATFSTLPPVAANVTFVGPLTGTRDGNQLSLTYVATFDTVLAGSCALSGFGTATIVDGTLTGTLSVITGSCDDLGVQPPTSMELILTKQ